MHSDTRLGLAAPLVCTRKEGEGDSRPSRWLKPSAPVSSYRALYANSSDPPGPQCLLGVGHRTPPPADWSTGDPIFTEAHANDVRRKKERIGHGWREAQW